MSTQAADNQLKSIHISKYWAEKLKEIPYISQKSGKTIHLLKNNSKPISKGKKRKVVPILGTLNEFKESKKKPAPQHQAE